VGPSLYPNDAQLLKVRALACDEVMKTAKEQHHGGDLQGSLKLAKLAHELDPSDEEANRHLIEYQADVDKTSQLAPPDTSSAPPNGKPGATVDLSPASAHVGQAVSFVGHVIAPAAGAKPRIDGAEFVLTAPGFPAAHVPALLEASGALDANYTFKRPGKYTVTFDARVGGTAVSATRTIEIAGAGAPLPVAPVPGASGSSGQATPAQSAAPATSDTAPAPSATGSGKWL
jgi:surface-anchored protein